MRDYTNEFKTIAEECGDADKFNNIQLRQGCYAYFLHGINYGEQERDSLQSKLSEAIEQRDKLQKLFLLAMNYIGLSPCDPDITNQQLDAWIALQNSGANTIAAQLSQQAKEE